MESKRPRRSTSARTRLVEGSRARSKRLSSIAASGSHGRELVDHQHRPSGAQDAVHLGQHELRPRDVVQRAAHADEIEFDPGSKGSAVASPSTSSTFAGTRLAPCSSISGDDVDADDRADERRQRDRELTGAGADVEGALLAVEGEQGCQPLPRRGNTTILVLGDRRCRFAKRFCTASDTGCILGCRCRNRAQAAVDGLAAAPRGPADPDTS